MPVIEKKSGAVFLRRDRILRGPRSHFEMLDAQLVAERRASISADDSSDDDRRFLRQMIGVGELVRGDVTLEHDALDHTGTVAHLKKVKLAARALVVKPAFERDLSALVSMNILDVNPGHEQVLAELSLTTERADGAQ